MFMSDVSVSKYTVTTLSRRIATMHTVCCIFWASEVVHWCYVDVLRELVVAVAIPR